MTYKLAKKIQSFIFDLDCERSKSRYLCATEKSLIDGDDWECYLFDRENLDVCFIDLVNIAQGIVSIVPSTYFTFGEYSYPDLENTRKAIIIH